MIREYINVLLKCLLVIINVYPTGSIRWDQIKCSADGDQSDPETTVADIGRFPWLGVVQHNFYIGGKVQFAITAAVLIHPNFAIAPAEDISRILRDQLVNNTKLILWHSRALKYALEVIDYALPQEFEERHILATLAILEIITKGETGMGEISSPVLPICLPVLGAGTFSDLYAVKMSDGNKDLQKEMYKMTYVSDKDCEEFYYKNKLTYNRMTPAKSICAKVERPMKPCIWDGGVALITRQSWGFWKLLGFSVRGAGCGAPARFLIINDYMWWFDEVATPPDPRATDGGLHRIGFRRLSPQKLVMFKAQYQEGKVTGQCTRENRGYVLYKDTFEINANKDFGQGFFHVVVNQIAQFTCATVSVIEAAGRTGTTIWIEHYCHREITGIAHGQGKPRDYRKQECFLYFKSTAFINFNFLFSWRARLELTVYGNNEVRRIIPNPFVTYETTDSWWPTARIIHWDKFNPYYLWAWAL